MTNYISALLIAIAQLENGPRHGYHSAYCLSDDALADVRSEYGKKFSNGDVDANPEIAMEVACLYLFLLSDTFAGQEGRNPSALELACCYRGGVKRWRKYTEYGQRAANLVEWQVQREVAK